MTHIKQIILEFLQTMRDDLKRRALDESGEQREETEQRIESLNDLIRKIIEGGE